MKKVLSYIVEKNDERMIKMKYYFDWKNNIDQKELQIAINELKNNKLILVPTETVYGIAANAFSDEACKRIYEAKGRASDNPLIVHVSDKEMLTEIAEQPNDVEQNLIDAFMPGPFTIILKKKKCICNTASSGLETIGVRMPSNSIIHELIKQSRIPIAAPSANISGRPSGTNVEDIKAELEDRIDVIIDGGKCKIGIESTVVKVIDGVPTILRPGFITEDDIYNVIGKVKLSDNLFKKVNEDTKVESPGMKYRHYAPKTKCVLVKRDEQQVNKVNELIHSNENVCVLGFKEDKNNIDIDDKDFIELGSINNMQEISQNVFSSLRKIDKMNKSLAIIEGVEKKDLGLSIMNRLVRACENIVL